MGKLPLQTRQTAVGTMILEWGEGGFLKASLGERHLISVLMDGRISRDGEVSWAGSAGL